MKKISTLLIINLIGIWVMAQQMVQQPKIIWKEDFSEGVIPDDWVPSSLSDSSLVWMVTDQPYPGSWYHDQQAPPISSKSGGFHLQYRPGFIIDKAAGKWKKAKVWPDAYIQSPAIDCSHHKSVILKFDQKFKWTEWYQKKENDGLFLAISTDGKNWKEVDIRNGINDWDESPNPMKVEMNITKLAAGEKTVYLRFIWRGLMMWYWMIDDIQLTEALDHDFYLEGLTSHKQTGNHFTDKEVLKVKVINEGGKIYKKDFTVSYILDNRPPVSVTVPAGKKGFGLVDTLEVAFPEVDLSYNGIHNLKFYTSLPEDKRRTNDTLTTVLYSQAYSLGEVTQFTEEKDNTFRFQCRLPEVKVTFYEDDIFRIRLSSDDHFTNPAKNDIVLVKDPKKVNIQWQEKKDRYEFKTPKVVLRAYKNPLRFELYKADNKSLIWSEKQPLTYGQHTVQYLNRDETEQFYGCGMQNGNFSHRDQKVLIENGGGWDDGGRPNPVPFYMSTKGYGALRNTFDPGVYDFKDTLKLDHKECRFDCFYFCGGSLKNILDQYTRYSGRPFLPPIWGLEMGDANCYNRNGETTPVVISKIADKYREHDMPGGWILPNDGYGCGYVKLDSTVNELHKRGFYTGLWTQYGVDQIATEVGDYGSRLCKLDVAWVGPGYKFALDACKTAYEGIENNSDSRGFIWSVCGWAGTHRYSVVWSGDQSGDWEYIRFHIPTLIGSGLSAQNSATGDIDGIFGGSAETYVRDLQWKCFTPVFMTMSGWAKYDKQPWVHGEPYSSINRQYLKLKMRLTPYMYTYCNTAYETGVPAVRGMVLEYPEDPVCQDTTTQFQFLSGEWMLVAPIYQDTTVRDDIYLPEGKWIDYWDGTEYTGKTTLNGYQAPLEKLPLFIKAGAIIPMYPEMLYNNEKPKNPLTFDIYPYGKTSFSLYEDDGLTRQHRKGLYAKTIITCKGSDTGKEPIEITVGKSEGDFNGKLKKRINKFEVHIKNSPKKVLLEGQKLKRFKSKEQLEGATEGWYFNSSDRKGTLHIKTAPLSTDKAFDVRITR